jgi:hypothetical protein
MPLSARLGNGGRAKAMVPRSAGNRLKHDTRGRSQDVRCTGLWTSERRLGQAVVTAPVTLFLAWIASERKRGHQA